MGITTRIYTSAIGAHSRPDCGDGSDLAIASTSCGRANGRKAVRHPGGASDGGSTADSPDKSCFHGDQEHDGLWPRKKNAR